MMWSEWKAWVVIAHDAPATIRVKGFVKTRAELEAFIAALKTLEPIITASAIEARRAATEGAVHESAVGEAETPKETI